jgi:hypothetical protein
MMQAATVIFILYALSGQATLTPIAQYESKDACQVVENVMNAAVANAPESAKFKCIASDTMLEMLKKNGIE